MGGKSGGWASSQLRLRDWDREQDGQGQPHSPDQQHEVPGQDGAVAALQVYRGVS